MSWMCRPEPPQILSYLFKLHGYIEGGGGHFSCIYLSDTEDYGPMYIASERKAKQVCSAGACKLSKFPGTLETLAFPTVKKAPPYCSGPVCTFPSVFTKITWAGWSWWSWLSFPCLPFRQVPNIEQANQSCFITKAKQTRFFKTKKNQMVFSFWW